MNNKNFETYIDYGSSKIRSVSINKNDYKNIFFYESDNYQNNSNTDDEIYKLISYVEKNTNEYLENINLMIDSSKMQAISLSLSKIFDGSILRNEDVKFLVQDARQQVLRNHFNKNIIHIIVKRYKIDNIEYSFLPENINCNVLSIDILFICLPKIYISQLKTFFSKYDVSINKIFCSSYVKSLSYKDNFDSIENICFVDIGFNKTSIIFYNNSEIIFFYILPMGSNNITKDIAKVLDLDLVNAEKIKLYFEKDKSFLIKNELSFETVLEIIISRVEEIFELTKKKIKLNVELDQFSNFSSVFIGQGSRILDNKSIKNYLSLAEIDIFHESRSNFCECIIKLNNDFNKQEVILIPKKQIKEGFFEKLFHFFR